ncbi:MAG TPA: cupin domain-containing protein [Gaiellaceae bacterium]|nr:cupin domain-containing protein [Gaiellaceae bacterium]
MDDKVNLADALASFDEAFAPRIVGRYNESKIAVAKTGGEFVWRKDCVGDRLKSVPETTSATDDLFLVLAGKLTIQLRDRGIELEPDELYVVPRGVEHCPRVDDEEAHVLSIETAGTPNTGDSVERVPAREIAL